MKTKNSDIIKFIGERVRFDDFGGGYFWGEQPNGGEQMIAEIRGYGAIQNLFLNESGCDINKANQFQDDLGRFIADAINEKIERNVNGGIRKQIDEVMDFLKEDCSYYAITGTVFKSDITKNFKYQKVDNKEFSFDHIYFIQVGSAAVEDYFSGTTLIPIGDDVYLQCEWNS
jgi:hypothetical protein